MSHNVLKLSKPHSQPTIHPVSSTHSLYHPQNHPSIDYPKERDSVSHSKDHSNSHAGIKKLANMLNPRKERGLTLQDIHNSMSPNHTSPKGFLENSSKMNKLRVSTSTHENQNLNLISPKDLVRMAMSKHKSKANLKKVSNPTTTGSNQRNMRKSHSLRFGPGIAGLEKREGSSKLISSSIVDESNALSRTSLASKDKTAKLRRMKQIYNDITPTEIARQTRSTMYTPVNETSGRFWQDSLSPNRSNSGNLLPASPAVVTSATSQQNNAVNKSKHHANAVQSKEEKGEKSHSEQMGAFLKEYKPSMKQGKRQEKKTLQARKMPSMENIKQNSMSFSRLMSHPTLNLGEKNRSPMKGMERDEEVVKAAEILEESDEMKGKDIKPREEFIADLKNWVNDIVKPSEEKGGQQQQQQVQQGKKSVGPAEKVKEAQEGLLEKLRDALENDEFVRREDYERLYREKDVIEEELDEVKEENSKLREIVWQMQQELERKKSVLPMNISMSDHDGELLETIGKLQKEVEMYRKRENVVKDVIKLIWKAGIEIGGLGFDEDIQEVHEGEEEEHTQAVKKSKQGSKYESPEKFYHNNNHYNVHDVHEEFGKDEDDGMQFELYNKGLLGQKDEMENVEETPKTKVVKAMSELGDSETEPSDRNGNLQGLPINPQSEKKLKSAGIGGKSNSTGKLKIDLRGLGGNLTIPKKQTSLPCNTSNNKSIDKMNPCVIPEGVQALGFHEEFMSKLEEFSLSWRQAALDHQKF